MDTVKIDDFPKALGALEIDDVFGVNGKNVPSFSPKDEALLSMCVRDDDDSSTPLEDDIIPVMDSEGYKIDLSNSVININRSEGIQFGSRQPFPAGYPVCGSPLDIMIPQPALYPEHKFQTAPNHQGPALGKPVLSDHVFQERGVDIPLDQSTQSNNGVLPSSLTLPGANITNSRDIQLGTRIIIGYPYRHPKEDSPSSKEVDIKTYLKECRNHLTSEYLRRTGSMSLLPWQNQRVPIDEYYTELKIFAVDIHERPTKETVNLVELLEEGEEKRLLIEGEAGMGKTLLAHKLAHEWAQEKCLNKFKLVIMISLLDFKSNIKQYISEELLPSEFHERFEKVWKYCKNHEQEILFILDGYDELEDTESNKEEIHKLLKSKEFSNSKVVMTSRPDTHLPNNTGIKRLVVKGFCQDQILKFIERYFKLENNSSSGWSLQKKFESESKYSDLARSPLFCVLLCKLYDMIGANQSLPEKMSEVILNIILCLIKWNNKKKEVMEESLSSFPKDYESLFMQFGKVCATTEKCRFSEQDMQAVDDAAKLIQVGFLMHDSESHILGKKRFWKPVHQIFSEYFAAFYISKHIRQCNGCKECKNFSRILWKPEVLKFSVGILREEAYRILSHRRKQLMLSTSNEQKLLLLKEAGPSKANCQAVSRLLDRKVVSVTSSEEEFEGWSYLLPQNFKKLRTLEIIWRIKSSSPDQESSFKEASKENYDTFFKGLNKNSSITRIIVRLKQDGEDFKDEKMNLFFSYLHLALTKRNMKEFEIREMKMNGSSYLKDAIHAASFDSKQACAMSALRILKLDILFSDKDLEIISNCLKKSAPNIRVLHLNGLEHGASGFSSLASLIKTNKRIQELSISMNKENLVSFGTKGNYDPSIMEEDHRSMCTRAKRLSLLAYEHQVYSEVNEDEAGLSKSAREPTDSNEFTPQKEFEFLFDSGDTNKKLVLEFHDFWIVRCGDEWLPLPLCTPKTHKSVFHYLFSVLPESNLKTLILVEPFNYLHLNDLICLGDALRKSSLTSLDLRNVGKVDGYPNGYIPILLSLGQSHHLAHANLDSVIDVPMTDVVVELLCRSLRHNKSLKSLSLCHWHFYVQRVDVAMSSLCSVMNSWQIEEVNLKHCKIDIGTTEVKSDSGRKSSASSCSTPTGDSMLIPPVLFPIGSPLPVCRSLQRLQLMEVEIVHQYQLIRRGNLILPLFRDCSYLRFIDLSATSSRKVILDDSAAVRFFHLISTSLKKLHELILDEWEFSFQHYKETCIELGHKLKGCKSLKTLQLNKVKERRPENMMLAPIDCQHTLLHQIVSHCPSLGTLSLKCYMINDKKWCKELVQSLGACFNSHWDKAEFQVKFFDLPPDIERDLVRALSKPPYTVKKQSRAGKVYIMKRTTTLNSIKLSTKYAS